jgi:hypothetical protein
MPIHQNTLHIHILNPQTYSPFDLNDGVVTFFFSQIYFSPYLFYFYFYYFIFSLVILRFTLLFINRLFGLLPFPVIATSHTIFSHYSHPAPRAELGHTETGSRTGIREATFHLSLSLSPPPPTLF